MRKAWLGDFRRRVVKRPVNGLGIALVVFAAAHYPAGAQTQSGTGGLNGQVFCSDTQKPARFAMVSLVPDVTVPADETNNRRRGYGASSTNTAADGSFSMKDVPAGVYDVQVMMPGYVQPVRQLNMYADAEPQLRQVFINMLTRVTIEAGQTANANVTAYRGADLIGSVYYDDGSPAGGISVSALLSTTGGSASDAASSSSASGPGSAASNLRAIGSNSQTDDRGRYHISGLADGTYSVQALPRSGGLFPVFLGNTIDRTKSASVTVRSGEERAGLDLILNISDLHRVRGTVTSPDNHALPNTTVSLTLANSTASQLSATTGPDGSFLFAAVPDGKFTVAISGAFDPDTRVVYKAASKEITVTGSDVSDANLSATE